MQTRRRTVTINAYNLLREYIFFRLLDRYLADKYKPQQNSTFALTLYRYKTKVDGEAVEIGKSYLGFHILETPNLANVPDNPKFQSSGIPLARRDFLICILHIITKLTRVSWFLMPLGKELIEIWPNGIFFLLNYRI